VEKTTQKGALLPNIIPLIKARRIRWTERAARMGDNRGA
jgi:hypothetical protein